MDLSPPPANLHSETVCFAFTYTYNLKESFRSWISPRPPHFKISIGPFRISGASRWASFGLKRVRSLSSPELEVAQSFICNIVHALQLLWFNNPLGLYVVYIMLIYFRRRDYTSALDMVIMLLNKCTPADVRQNNSSVLLPHVNVSSESQQDIIRFYESVLRFSQISSLPVSGSWSALYHRHLLSRADTSVWGKAPHETSVARRWMEMYQRWINTPNNFPSYLPPCNRCYSSVMFSLPWCNVVPLLFIYPLIPVLVLSGCGNWMCMHGTACMHV